MPGEVPKYANPSNGRRPARGGSKKTTVPRELVLAVADRVYALFLHEMKIERERQRFQHEFRRR
jgi:hypothetical protein